MGRQHITTLQEFTSAKSQERVGENINENNETTADAPTTSTIAREPPKQDTVEKKKTYAEIVRRGRVRFESEQANLPHHLTLKK